jgi:steroid 5-alpha reductase family enzyme
MIVLPFGWQPFIAAFVTILVLLHVVWFFAYKHKRNDYADILWGPGFGISAWVALAWTYFVQGRTEVDGRTLAACLLVSIWGARLFWHIGVRNIKKNKEDERYAKWRQEWGASQVWRSYLQVFLLQGLIMFIINFAVFWIIASPPQGMDLLAQLGIVVWAIGFIFESLGDAQLKDFTSKPENRGKLINVGLWSWSRHPNYFGEVVQWWGVFMLSLGLPGGWMTVISPIAITFLILKVSGIPMLEEQMKDRRGFEEYKRRTSKFFPLPPKKA